jgi:hypothetical protein
MTAICSETLQHYAMTATAMKHNQHVDNIQYTIIIHENNIQYTKTIDTITITITITIHNE